MEPSLILKSGRERSLERRHPWVFSGAVAQATGSPGLGDTVEVLSAKGEFLARAAYSPGSQIRARVWTWDPEEAIDEAFFRRRLENAIAARDEYWPVIGDKAPNSAVRLVHAESDGLPGLVVDRYSDTLAVQILSAGPERWRETLADLLMQLTGARSLYERSDVEARQLEGLQLTTGLLRGEPAGRIEVDENGVHFWVDVAGGHKTGFYLDQRVNRQIIGKLAQGKDVLDCFCYTGGFTAYCLANAAKSVLSVDASAEAMALLRQNLELNHLLDDRASQLEGDIFQVLRRFRDSRQSYDLIILDPPKFAQTAAQVEKAARGYKDINLLAFKLLRPGGLLATFSCSGGVSEELFQKIVAGAALDARVEAQIIQRLHQAPDHPVALNFPEGAYLKGFIVQVR